MPFTQSNWDWVIWKQNGETIQTIDVQSWYRHTPTLSLQGGSKDACHTFQICIFESNFENQAQLSHDYALIKILQNYTIKLHLNKLH